MIKQYFEFELRQSRASLSLFLLLQYYTQQKQQQLKYEFTEFVVQKVEYTALKASASSAPHLPVQSDVKELYSVVSA